MDTASVSGIDKAVAENEIQDAVQCLSDHTGEAGGLGGDHDVPGAGVAEIDEMA
jgi:hypothetical protein